MRQLGFARRIRGRLHEYESRRRPADSFRSALILGGRLSILNGLAWIALVTATGEVVSMGNGRFADIFRIASLVLSVPLATYLILFRAVGQRPGLDSIVTEAIVIGLNSLVWGYTLAWFVGKVANLIKWGSRKLT